MKKKINIHSLMNICVMIIFGILAILKLGRHRHKGVCESAGNILDTMLKKLRATLDKASLFVKHTIKHAH